MKVLFFKEGVNIHFHMHSQTMRASGADKSLDEVRVVNQACRVTSDKSQNNRANYAGHVVGL